MSTAKPDLTRIWASGAAGVDIEDPDVTSPGKFAAGWSAEIPPFENFNFLQQLFTQGMLYISENGIGEWDTDTTYPIDGIVRGSDSEYYQAIVEQNGNDPISDGGTNWVLWITSKSGTVETTVITASDPTFTPDPLTKAIRFTVVGGGGGGGGVDGQGTGTAAIGMGGSAAGTCIKTNSTVDSTYAIIIGAGGAGGASGNNTGLAGGNSTVISASENMQANGGLGGPPDIGSGSNQQAGTAISGSFASGGDLNFEGDGVSSSFLIDGNPSGFSVSGGTVFGGSVESGFNSNGRNATTPGAGGGGVATRNQNNDYSGGDGADGIVIVEEFF